MNPLSFISKLSEDLTILSDDLDKLNHQFDVLDDNLFDNYQSHASDILVKLQDLLKVTPELIRNVKYVKHQVLLSRQHQLSSIKLNK